MVRAKASLVILPSTLVSRGLEHTGLRYGELVRRRRHAIEDHELTLLQSFGKDRVLCDTLPACDITMWREMTLQRRKTGPIVIGNGLTSFSHIQKFC